MRRVLALDQSTSATKALLFDESGRCLDRESRTHQQYYPQPGWVEHDAEEIWQNTLAVLRAVLERSSSSAPICLSIANQRETIVIFDRATGRPLHRAIVWQCRRGDALCEAQKQAGREDAIHRRTGLRVDSYFSASKLQWLLRSSPELRAQVEAGSALIGTIDCYLVYRLTAGAVFATDCTNASRTLLYDIGQLGWDAELCAWWEVPMNALPEVRESTASFGTTTLEGTLVQPLPICGVMGDSQASLFGQQCYAPGDAKVTFGTGSSVMMNIGREPRFPDNGVVTALAWIQNGVPTYAVEGIIISSASGLVWLRDQLAVIEELDHAEAMTRELADNDGVYLVPAFSGLGLPYWQPEARGAIVGLTSHSDRRHLVRACLESMAYQLHDVIEAMKDEAGVRLTTLCADGGPTANSFLMQFIADVTGVELHISTASEGSALGAALAGLLGSGGFASPPALHSTLRRPTAYQPQMNRAEADRLIAGWRRAIRSVLTNEPALSPV
jgi:glycerol kinase